MSSQLRADAADIRRAPSVPTRKRDLASKSGPHTYICNSPDQRLKRNTTQATDITTFLVSSLKKKKKNRKGTSEIDFKTSSHLTRCSQLAGRFVFRRKRESRQDLSTRGRGQRGTLTVSYTQIFSCSEAQRPSPRCSRVYYVFNISSHGLSITAGKSLASGEEGPARSCQGPGFLPGWEP